MTENDNKDTILLGGEFVSLMRPPKKKRSGGGILPFLAILLAVVALGAAAFALFGDQPMPLSEDDSSATQSALKSTDDAFAALKLQVDALVTQQGTSAAFLESQFATATATLWTATPTVTPTETPTPTLTPTLTFTPSVTPEPTTAENTGQGDASNSTQTAGTGNTESDTPEMITLRAFEGITIVTVRSSAQELQDNFLYNMNSGDTVQLVTDINGNYIREWESAKNRYWYRVICDTTKPGINVDTQCWIVGFRLFEPSGRMTETPTLLSSPATPDNTDIQTITPNNDG